MDLYLKILIISGWILIHVYVRYLQKYLQVFFLVNLFLSGARIELNIRVFLRRSDLTMVSYSLVYACFSLSCACKLSLLPLFIMPLN